MILFIYYNRWFDEFIVYFLFISCLHSFFCTSISWSFANANCIIRKLHTFPPLVSVHCVVPAGNGCKLADSVFFHFSFGLLNATKCCLRTHISSLSEPMSIYFCQPFFFG